MLGAEVVASLCRVRDEEANSREWTQWFQNENTSSAENNLRKRRLPAPLAPVRMLPGTTGPPSTLSDDARRPTVQQLVDEVRERLSHPEQSTISSVVLAGEGEPTLRLGDLLKFVSELHELSSDTDTINYKLPPIRLTTNGLVESSSEMVACHLKTAGVHSVSVALMTGDPQQYDDLMHPLIDHAHYQVCQFLENAVKVGLEVETTGVDRPDIDKEMAERLSLSLGVEKPMRWRPYFE